MRRFRLFAAGLPFAGYAFRWAVRDGFDIIDLAATRRAALRRRPAVPASFATAIPIRKADA